MKERHFKRIISFLLILGMLMTMAFGWAIPTSAQNIIGSINSSGIRANEGVVLFGDTTLNMDTDLTVPYIKGDYNLTVKGNGKLTVNGSDNGIDVKNFECYSDLFVQPGWHAIDVTETVYINNTDSFIVGGIYAEGDIEIQSNNATIGGNGNAIFSNGGNITLGGSTFDIGANGIAVYAKTGNINMTGAFTVNSNNDRTIHAGMGELVINGSLKSTSGAQFDPDVHFASRDNFSIGATGGINFYGTTLEVTGLGGIRGGGVNLDADISIIADSVSIITERYYALNGGNIYVDSDELWLENEGSEENENVPYIFHTIFADGDATLYSENGGIVGENCLFADGNLTLNGNFVVGADHDSGYAMRSIGRTEVNGNLRVITDDILCVYAEDGFSFNGTTLDIEGYGGINADGGVNITADNVSILAQKLTCVEGQTVYIDCDVLRLENVPNVNDSEVGQYGIACYESATVNCPDATIIACDHGVYGNGCDVTLNGNFTILGKGSFGKGIWASNLYLDGEQFTVSSNILQAIDAGHVEVRGNLSLSTEGEYYCLTAEAFVFDGSTLTVNGYGGIDTEGGVNITADSTTIITSVSSPIASTGYVYVDSDYLFLQNLMEEELHPLADWAGISAYGDVTVISDDATIIGRFGIRVAEWLEETNGNVYLRGNFHVIGTTDQAILCDNDVTVEGSLTAQGSVVEQGSDNPYNYGECYAIRANNFSFNGTMLDVEGYAGILTDGNIGIIADSVVITTDVGTAISGCEVYVTANDLWAENKATKVNSNWQSRGYTQHGISAESKLSLTVEGGTVIGYDDALHVYDENDQFEYHYIYVNGHLTAVSQTGVGMYAPQGIVQLYGGPIVSVGESHGIDAKDVVFEGGSLRVEGGTGIYALDSVELAGQDIKITAFNERRSGIWVENGYVDLEGKVVINTNGWYGISAGGDITFNEGYYEISGPEGNAYAVNAGGTLSVDGTLEIIQPDGGHINGNDIYGPGDSPALEVMIYSAITDVSLYIDPPREGELPGRKASDVYSLDPRCTVEEIIWYEDGEEMVSQDAVFRAGHRYTVKITLSADDPYRFVDGVMGKVNGKAVTTGMLGGDKKGMILTADLRECPKAVDTVELEIKAPVEGNTPSKGVTAGNSSYGVYSRDVRWAVSTDGINFVSMEDGEKFVGGKYYRVFMDVNLAGNQYKFPVTTATGSVQPDVISYVNGNLAVTEKAYDQDPETVITVYFDFGKCNDFLIEEIDIVDVVAPVAGKHPTYTANMFGTGYHVDTTKNSYEDIYWKNPPEKWYYVKNGVQWWDVTDGEYDYVYENDVFLPGHQYECLVYVCTDDGYELGIDLYTEPETWPTATMNGNPAEIVTGWTDTWNTRVTYTFTCEETEVTDVIIDGIDKPQSGKMPDCSATVASPELYVLDTEFGTNGIKWYDCEGNELESGEAFGNAGPYCIAMKLVSAKTDTGDDLAKFSDDVRVYIDGKEVTAYGQWDEVVVGDGELYVYYTFKNSSSAPELEVQGSVYGSISSPENTAGDMTVQLISKESGEISKQITVNASGSFYKIDAVANGEYYIRVSKAGCMTYQGSIVVSGDLVKKDIALYNEGDLNLDGSINITDMMSLKIYLAYGRGEVWQYDVNGDGSVNITDMLALKRILT